MRPRLPPALLALCGLLVVLLAAVVLLAGGSSRSSKPVATGAPPQDSAGDTASASGFDGAALPADLPAHDFTLTDVLSGETVSLSRFSGQVTVIAFPYSTCGPTCTLLAQQVRGALDELPRPVPVLFISADPQADSPARVSRFLAEASLTGRVNYLSGTSTELGPVWHAYGVAPASAGRAAYAAHVALFLLDGQGRERVVFGLEQLTPEALAHDICKLGHDCAAP